MPSDVLILGAGAAGLTAAIDLARAGLRVEILEARDRIGGRMFTRLDPTLNHPIELGAEFAHGLPPEIWLPIQRHNLHTTEVDGDLWCSLDGNLQQCNFFAQADKILAAMNDNGPDESFLDFLARRFPDAKHAEAKQWATNYVSGFNAANPAEVSVHWLVNNQRAEEQIEGHRAFRIKGGYQSLINIFRDDLLNAAARAGMHSQLPIRLNAIAQSIRWRTGSVEIETQTENGIETLTAQHALITLPLGVLQAPQSVHFDPPLPADKQSALQKLTMGKVVRVTLCFRHPFWDAIRPNGKRRSLSDLSFLFSRHELFPTWWTEMPEHLPIITGWAPASSPEKLAGMTDDQIINQALDALSSLLRVTKSHVESQLVSAYFHNWDNDPFSRGAYSYAKVGGEGCQQVLGSPLDNTLFFAGEHTDTTGHNGTVHAAIASGHRASKEILRALGK